MSSRISERIMALFRKECDLDRFQSVLNSALAGEGFLGAFCNFGLSKSQITKYRAYALHIYLVKLEDAFVRMCADERAFGPMVLEDLITYLFNIVGYRNSRAKVLGYIQQVYRKVADAHLQSIADSTGLPFDICNDIVRRNRFFRVKL